jgi:hypothetical protein
MEILAFTAVVFILLVIFALMANWSLDLIEQALADMRQEDMPPTRERGA